MRRKMTHTNIIIDMILMLIHKVIMLLRNSNPFLKKTIEYFNSSFKLTDKILLSTTTFFHIIFFFTKIHTDTHTCTLII